MLYVTTRVRGDAFTAIHALTENRGPEGGFFVPLRLPRLNAHQIAELEKKPFAHTVAEILNQFFGTQIDGHEMELGIGRYPVKLIGLNGKATVAKTWHNPVNRFDRLISGAEKVIRQSGQYDKDTELKAATINAKEKGKLYRSMNPYYKFGVIVEQSKVMDSIMADKKSKQRYLDFVLKIGVKKLLQRLIAEKVILPEEVEGMYFFVDEHTTSTNGRYELRESLEEEFKRGMFSHNFVTFFPPLFPQLKHLDLEFCNSATKTLVRAADIVCHARFLCRGG